MSVRIALVSVFCLFSIHLLKAQCDDLEVDAGPDRKFCEGETMGLYDAVLSGEVVRHFWEPMNRVLNPESLTTQVSEPGTYTLTASAWDYSTNLVENGGFESGNNGFTNQYDFVPPTGPFDNTGMYAIDNSPIPYSPTGPGQYLPCLPLEGSNMLIARGTNSVGASVWCQTIAIEPQTDYHFIFFSSNVGTSHPSQFEVLFNSTRVSGFTNTGLDCTWNEHEAFWFSRASTSVEICIYSVHQNNPGKLYANAFTLDNIQLYGTCKKSDEVTLEVIDMPVDAEDHEQPCGEYVVEIPLTDYPTGDNYRVNWTTDDGTIIRTLPEPPFTAFVNGEGVYVVELIYDDGVYQCVETKEVVVVENPVGLDAYPEERVPINCSNSRALLAATDTNTDHSYHWFTENGNIDGDGNGTEIKVTQEGTYYLVEVDPIYGCKDTSAIEIFSQDDIPQAIILGEEMMNCATPEDLILNGTNSYVGEDDYFRWSSANGNFSSSTADLEVSVDEAGIYYLIIVDSITLCADTAKLEIFADYSTPSVLIPDSIVLDCAGNDQVEVFNLRSNESDVGLSWEMPSSTVYHDTIMPEEEGVYILTAIDSSSLCMKRDTLVLEDIREIPPLNIDPADILDCRTSSVELQGIIDPNQGNINFEWSTESGNILGNSTSKLVQVDQPGWYLLHIENEVNGCKNQDSVYVDLNTDLPVLNVGDTLELTCSDDFVVLEGITDFNFPELEWGWYTTDGNIVSDAGESNINVDAAGRYYFFIFNPVNGCADTLEQVLEPNEEIPLLSIPTPDILNCIRINTTLKANGTSVSGSTLSYAWFTSNGRIAGNPNQEEINVDRPGTYLVEITDINNGCTNRSSVQVDIDTLSPRIDLMNTTILDCETTTLNLSPLQDENPDFQYTWSTAEGQIMGSNQSYDIEISEGGIYSITVLDPANGCENQKSIEIPEDRETPTAALAEPEHLTCKQLNVVLNAEQSDQGIQMDFLWSTNNGNFVDLTDSLHPIVDHSGDYQLVLVNRDNACKDSIEVSIIEDRNPPEITLNEPDSLACYRSQTEIAATVNSFNQQEILNWTTTNGNIVRNDQGTTIAVDQEGVYYIEVEDLVNGCKNLDSISVFRDPEEPRGFELDMDEALCPDEVTNMAVLSIDGGRAPYTVVLDNQTMSLNEETEISPGLHTITILDGRDCSIEQEIFVPEAPRYDFNLLEEIEIEVEEELILRPQLAFDPANIESAQWYPEEAVACPNCLITEFIGTESTSLELIMTTRSGCELFGRSLINVYVDKTVWVPNTFSPNGDGNNDFFTVYVKDRSVAQVNYLKIFNRWGDNVFHKEKFPPNIGIEGWDGDHVDQPMNPAVFVYVTEVQFVDGSTVLLAGDVTLVR